jgi:hypothetical protein
MGLDSPNRVRTQTGAVFLSYATQDLVAAQRICAASASMCQSGGVISHLSEDGSARHEYCNGWYRSGKEWAKRADLSTPSEAFPRAAASRGPPDSHLQ